MDRFEAMSIYRTMLGQIDIESKEIDKLTEIAENKTNCSGDACGIAWKPTLTRNDINEEKE